MHLMHLEFYILSTEFVFILDHEEQLTFRNVLFSREKHKFVFFA